MFESNSKDPIENNEPIIDFGGMLDNNEPIDFSNVVDFSDGPLELAFKDAPEDTNRGPLHYEDLPKDSHGFVDRERLSSEERVQLDEFGHDFLESYETYVETAEIFDDKGRPITDEGERQRYFENEEREEEMHRKFRNIMFNPLNKLDENGPQDNIGGPQDV